MYQIADCRVFFRPILANSEDAYRVARWRNTDEAREAFFSDKVVTPDTHIEFMKHRKPHDLVWIVGVDTRQTFKHAIGMTALIVDVDEHIGEYGRTYIDQDYRGKGYAEDTEFTLLHYGFEFLRLKELWLDALTNNIAIINLHKKLGWLDAGTDVFGHTDEKGPVVHMVYTKECWQNNLKVLQARAKERLNR